MTPTAEYHFFRGRVAQHAILKALRLGPGDEVAVQAFTCVALPAPVLMLGAKPLYIDIDPTSYNVNLGHLSASITKRTKAVIVQHTFGIPAEMDPIVEISRRWGAAVVEDCCHTLASAYKGKTVGSFGAASFTSHRWGKPIVLGAGGTARVRGEDLCVRFHEVCVTSQNTPRAKVLQVLIEYLAHENLLRPSMFWIVRDIFRMLSRRKVVMPTFDEHELRGLMVDAGRRIPEVHRRWLVRRLIKLNQNTAHRRAVANRYGQTLKGLGAQTFSIEEYMDPVFLRYPFLVNDKPRLLQKARERRIELGDWFVSAVHPLLSPDDLKRVGYEIGSCPVAEAVAQTVVTLPIHKGITQRYVEKTINFLDEAANEGLLEAPIFMERRRAQAKATCAS